MSQHPHPYRLSAFHEGVQAAAPVRTAAPGESGDNDNNDNMVSSFASSFAPSPDALISDSLDADSLATDSLRADALPENHPETTVLAYEADPVRAFHAAPLRPAARFSTHADHALARARNRLLVTAVTFTCAFALIGARLTDATVLRGGEPSIGQSAPTRSETASRADIVDRNGVLLATSLPTHSLSADPKKLLNPEDAARRLSAVLPDLDPTELLQKLKSDKRFVWIKRNLPPRQYHEAHRLGIPGLTFEREERRVYPVGHSAAHVVGFAGVDNNGLAGVEQQFNRRLRESSEPLQLSIDVRLQHILRKELQTAITDFTAIGGAGMIYDVNTAEVLAMVSLPDFDPQLPSTTDEETLFNRNTLGVYEMGSTFKIFNSAMALESGQVRLTDSFDATQPIHYGRFTINDFHGKFRWLTVSEIFMYSSNIGSVKMALAAGIAAQRTFLGKVGLLNPSPVELPEVGPPMVPNPWREINGMTIAFGHGLSVSAIQLVAATAATLNGGIMRPSTLLKREAGLELPGERVLSPQTSAQMRRLVRLVVTQGTASSAAVPGYVVGGKTGTAEKSAGRRYSQNARLSSFIGAFPMHDPRYIVFIMVDEPKANAKSQGYATGGWVAAPAVGRIIKQIGPLLGIPIVDENAPEIRRALDLDPRPTQPTTPRHSGTIAASLPSSGNRR